MRVGDYETTGAAYSVAVSGAHAFVADGNWPSRAGSIGEGLLVLDISDPANPVRVGATGGNAQSVAISGTHAYVVGGLPGLQVIDIGDPANPLLAGSVETPGVA